MMFTDPLARYIWFRTSIIFLESIGPLSLIYTVLVLIRLLPLHSLPFCLGYWAAAEALFYIPIYAWQKLYLQRPAKHPPLLSEADRRALFQQCFGAMQDTETFMEKWFLGAPLNSVKRENMREWVRWAFFNSAEVDPIYDEEIDGYIDEIEKKAQKKFEPGRSGVRCIRLSLDRIRIGHRSLTWYMCILVVDTIAHCSMLRLGFKYYRSSTRTALAVFPPRPQTFLASTPSPAKDLSYWYRPHTATNKTPILFLHGIGVGLYPYIDFLAKLKHAEDGGIGIIALEILPVSSRITQAVLPKETMYRQIEAILTHHGWPEVVLVSHSYGSVVVSQLLHSPDFVHRVTSLVLTDPVSVLLHFPDVAYNFTVRKPQSADEWLLYYFGSKDLGVAHTLGRRFFWSQNILWKEDLIGLRTSVFLSEKDDIVNTKQVFEYLEEAKHERSGHKYGGGNGGMLKKEAQHEKKEGQGEELNVVMCSKLHHGQMYDSNIWRGRLLKDVLGHAAHEFVQETNAMARRGSVGVSDLEPVDGQT